MGGDGGSITGLTPQDILMKTPGQRVEACATVPSTWEELSPLAVVEQLPAAQTNPVVYRESSFLPPPRIVPLKSLPRKVCMQLGM